MNVHTLLENFNRTLEGWIKALDDYDFAQLCTKPAATSWSLGQVYLHLIQDTNYFIDQIKVCVATNDHQFEEASSNAKKMFLNNDFPDEAIEGAPSNALIPQPDSKEKLLNDLSTIKDEMNAVGLLISKSPFKGKAKHPGLNYFNAKEWVQFAEMHLRHHLRQKKRIDDFLNSRSTT